MKLKRIASLFLMLLLTLYLTAGVSTIKADSPSTLPGGFSPEEAQKIAERLDNLHEAERSIAWKNLTEEEQKAVEYFLAPAYGQLTDVDVTVPLNSSNCLQYTQGYEMYNAVGWILWRYSQVIDWCYDGENVTFVTHYAAPQVNAPLWEFVGHINSNPSGGVGHSFFYHFTQGHFKLCSLGDWSCHYHVYPWVWQQVYGDGGTAGNAGN